MKTKIILVLLASGIAACGAEAQPKSLVHDLTILGVRAQPPEVVAGGTVSLDALAADPNGEGRAVEMTWYLCAIDPAVGSSSCDDEKNLTVIGAGPALDFTVPATALEQVPAEMRARGVDVFIALRATAGAEETNVSIKRVRVSENPAPNTNPSLERFDLDGVAMIDGQLTVPAGDVELFARVTEESHDEYIDDLGQPAVEEMKFAWFLTVGSFDCEVTWEDEDGSASTTWTAPESIRATLWVVLRDGRGGTDWRTIEVQAQ